MNKSLTQLREQQAAAYRVLGFTEAEIKELIGSADQGKVQMTEGQINEFMEAQRWSR
jgi:hypothetical protein